MLVETRVGKLFVDVTGEGPDVVLWHSLLCDGGMWREQVRALSERFRVINVDGPGHGKSERTTRQYTMDDCVVAATEVMDALDADRVAWIGLSWGGMVGMRLAARRPERVAALVLLDTSARAERPWKKIAYRPMTMLTAAAGPQPALGPVLRRIFFAPATLRDHPELGDRLVHGVVAMDKRALNRAVDAVIYGRVDCSHELSRINAPTLVIVGEHDRATPPGESERIARAIAGATLVRVPDAGHLSALEQPAQVNALIGAFLEAR